MAQHLQSGRYEPRTERVVTVWPKPDPDGDGDFVYVDMKSPEGEILGREILTTENGQEVRHYAPPAGFVNVQSREPGSNGTEDNYVRANERGGIHRNPAGEAVAIREGTALVEYPDGTHELLTGDYAQVLFGRAHVLAGGA